MSLIDDQVQLAGNALQQLRDVTLDERLTCVSRSAAALRDRSRAIIDLAVEETGTTEHFARRELDSALLFAEIVPTLADALRSQEIPARSGITHLSWEPYGVVFGWHAANSPIWVPVLVALSALTGGNAMIGRPSRRAVRTTTRVLETVAEGWPPGAVNVANVDRKVGEKIMVHPGVHAVVAHAATTTCREHLKVLSEAYATGTRMRPYIPEASGNDAGVVLQGADLRAAAAAIALGAFANSGQLCMATKRIIVDISIWPRFREALVDAVRRVADEPEHRTEIQEGSTAFRVGREALTEAVGMGGRVLTGTWPVEDRVRPTLVEMDATAVRQTRLWQTELFAPVRTVVACDDVHHAIALANDSQFGLGAALFGGTPAERELFTRGVRASRIVVDEGPLYQDPYLVVGGVGDSGLAGARPKLEQLVWAKRVHYASGVDSSTRIV